VAPSSNSRCWSYLSAQACKLSLHLGAKFGDRSLLALALLLRFELTTAARSLLRELVHFYPPTIGLV
jgi:hypothetical protein